MKVTSPVGDFPFEIKRVRTRSTMMTIQGSMGAWPASIQIEPSDVPALLRLAPAMVFGLSRVAVRRIFRGSSAGHPPAAAESTARLARTDVTGNQVAEEGTGRDGTPYR
jgi:hypothetical protein